VVVQDTVTWNACFLISMSINDIAGIRCNGMQGKGLELTTESV
jgi:hypothetical protein